MEYTDEYVKIFDVEWIRPRIENIYYMTVAQFRQLMMCLMCK